MELMFPIVMGISVLLVLGLGIMVKYCKAYWLIAGYNNMSAEQKKQVDIEGMASFIGNMCFVMAVILFLATVFIMHGREWLGGTMFGAILVQSVYIIIRSQKYDGNSKNPDGTMTTKSKLTIGGIVALITFISIGIGILFYYSNQPSEFVLEDEYLKIKGLYGETIPVKDIEEIYLKNDLPKITFKNNGYSLGSKKKGNFKLEDIGNAKLFVDTSQPPFIYLVRNGRIVILNYDQSEDTEELYQRLISAWSNSNN